jgi:hypothetical protein
MERGIVSVSLKLLLRLLPQRLPLQCWILVGQRRRILYRVARTPPFAVARLTSETTRFSSAIEVSPGVSCTSMAWAAPHSTAV